VKNNHDFPYHNLGLDMARATEAAALAGGRWMGRGDQLRSDHEAALAMLQVFDEINVNGRIVSSDLDKLYDEAPIRMNQSVGIGVGPEMDFVVDPIEGRNLLARGHPDAISVAAGAPRGAFWNGPPAIYMDKIVVDAEVASALTPECLDAPAAWTLALIARSKQKAVSDLIVFILNRPRHKDLIEEVRRAGARVMLRSEGDVVGALQVLLPSGGVDVLMGVGSLVDGLIIACATRAANGAMLGRLAPQSAEERDVFSAAADVDLDQALTVDQLVKSERVFFAATGVTDGAVLMGVHYHGERVGFHSLIMRGETHIRRMVHTEYLLDRPD
jgi:fructose-1,6-bisphosphatase II